MFNVYVAQCMYLFMADQYLPKRPSGDVLTLCVRLRRQSRRVGI